MATVIEIIDAGAIRTGDAVVTDVLPGGQRPEISEEPTGQSSRPDLTLALGLEGEETHPLLGLLEDQAVGVSNEVSLLHVTDITRGQLRLGLQNEFSQITSLALKQNCNRELRKKAMEQGQ